MRMLGMLSKGISPVIAATLLILMSITIGVVLYVFSLGFAGSVNEVPDTGILVIEEVIPRKCREGIVGFDVILSNPSGIPVKVGNLTALIIGNNKVIRTILVMTEYPLTIPAGGAGKVIMYPLDSVPPGNYYVKISGLGGGESIKPIKVTSKVWASRVILLTLNNNASNPATTEDDKAWYSAYIELNQATGLYLIWFNFTPKPGVTLTYRRAELLNANNNYPIWVGNNPYESVTPLSYPEQDIQYWTPVQGSELPVKVVFTSIAG